MKQLLFYTYIVALAPRSRDREGRIQLCFMLSMRTPPATRLSRLPLPSPAVQASVMPAWRNSPPKSVSLFSHLGQLRVHVPQKHAC